LNLYESIDTCFVKEEMEKKRTMNVLISLHSAKKSLSSFRLL